MSDGDELGDDDACEAGDSDDKLVLELVVMAEGMVAPGDSGGPPEIGVLILRLRRTPAVARW